VHSSVTCHMPANHSSLPADNCRQAIHYVKKCSTNLQRTVRLEAWVEYTRIIGGRIVSTTWSCKDGRSKVSNPTSFLLGAAGGNHKASNVGEDGETVGWRHRRRNHRWVVGFVNLTKKPSVETKMTEQEQFSLSSMRPQIPFSTDLINCEYKRYS